MKDDILNKNPNKKFAKSYDEIVTLENILKAWNKFKKGKSSKPDTNEFALRLTDNLLNLYYTLKSKRYIHGDYEVFEIVDIKKRSIHKSSVADRVVHHLLYNALYNYFDNKFIYDSYSCRKYKGVHKALDRYSHFARKVSMNYSKQAFMLKLDIQKCFASIDHEILKSTLSSHVQDRDILGLLFEIIDSHSVDYVNGIASIGHGKAGIPLGNLTSQLFVNIYLHELDYYCKHILKLKYYIRYADDVIIFFPSANEAEGLVDKINSFCGYNLKLKIHKVEIKSLYKGVDFLGWIHFPKHRVLRKVTKQKMLMNANKDNIASYEGLLGWGSGYKLSKTLEGI